MSEDYWERRRRAIEDGAKRGGVRGAKAAEIAFNESEKLKRRHR
jgi:hypothetical protein